MDNSKKRVRPSESVAIGFTESEFSVPQETIAKWLGMTKRQVQRIEYRALQKLKKAAMESTVLKELMAY
jgi:transcriptional regulator